ncbi:CDP-diacylglycerol--glycerol-3-phosphate 3-phosphatidyltransferase [Marinobacterium arenosum]|uniref:CDP-diacylglycerol--glycerol-3-phosphate 3-phosphatidyltransferase n=1 Tax=Marinobacterium arenosum TaxID=2862496 RepID=UPI001C93AA2E|nr:CDP-diacylglycerol--glycerol-3-phosphate 3-phosphatidyltransferase [Marinobacterium arenosum]MBY4677214.1 CDP-diacylglycerol--glycerol-3-phosphate 3-phosphatidyltransferase [Marinobacterium arenosum]
MTIPNLLTLLRIVLIPVFVLCYYLPVSWAAYAAGAVFAAAAVTDWFDGYLARRLDQMSTFGAFLDPVADKLIVAAALVLLVESYSTPWLTLPAVVIIGREIVISALREWMAELGKRASVAVSYVGKVKTTLQMLAILLLVVAEPYSQLGWAGLVSLYLSALLTLWSMLEYLKAAWPELAKEI